MREFPQQNLLSNLADGRQLNLKHIDSMARVIANFHMAAIPVSVNENYGSCETVKKWCNENIDQLRQVVPQADLPEFLSGLESWQNKQLDMHSSFIQQRKLDGFVRDCHGDLHLANITLIDKQCTPFDCIEFNQELRCIDTMSEIAFVFMDLIQRDYRDLAWRFLNQYLEITGDFAGLPLLYFYSVYRALVRAKVEALNKNTDTQHCRHYLDLANSFTQSKPGVLVCMHGLSGSGKSTVASKLAMTLGAIHIRSDVERKRLFELDATADSKSSIDNGIYTHDASRQTYQHLYSLCEKLLNHGFIVIVDATFLQFEQREQFRSLAQQHDISNFLVSCQAPENELRERIKQRQTSGHDASEAGIEVLEKQLQSQHPLTQTETGRVTTIINHRAELATEQLNLILDAR